MQCSAVQRSAVQHSTVQYSTVQYSTAQYSTVQYSAVQQSAVQQSAVQCRSGVQCSASYMYHSSAGSGGADSGDGDVRNVAGVAVAQ